MLKQLPEHLNGQPDGKTPQQSELEGGPVTPESNGSLQDIIIEAQAKSFILKLKSDVVIRLIPDTDSTLVDMRSASHWGPHDFGINAKNINDFMTELDVVLAGVDGER